MSNSFTDDELRGMITGDNPQSNAYRELLALREAQSKPVAVVELSDYIVFGEERKKAVRELYEGAFVVGQQLYAAPQLPAVLDGDPRDEFELQFPMPKFVQRCGKGYSCSEFHAWDAHKFIERWHGWNACRAAMLKSVTNEP